jgi:NAD(P)-dependent dehydrogenase (short-subunit alcohol dehydrogenase family)
MNQSTGGELMLAGKVAVVTGSTQGVGAGIARKFGEQGARVVVHGLESQKAGGEKVVAAIQASGSQALLIVGDLKDEAHCRAVIRRALECFGRIDILVNNAAVSHRGNIENTSVALWDEIFATNVRAHFILCQEAVKHMKAEHRGCIINIGSSVAYIGLRNLLPYSASKGALMTFSKNLAHYLTQYRIRVNLINPGWILTEGEHYIQSVVEGQGENWLDQAVKTRPFGRMLLPEDIAKAALFFATNELLTGAVLDYEQFPFGAPEDNWPGPPRPPLGPSH